MKHRHILQPSCIARNMVDDSGTDEEIPLPNVKTAILSKVIDYCKYHKDSPPEEIQKPLKSTNLVPWETEDFWLKVDVNEHTCDFYGNHDSCDCFMHFESGIRMHLITLQPAFPSFSLVTGHLAVSSFLISVAVRAGFQARWNAVSPSGTMNTYL